MWVSPNVCEPFMYHVTYLQTEVGQSNWVFFFFFRGPPKWLFSCWHPLDPPKKRVSSKPRYTQLVLNGRLSLSGFSRRAGETNKKQKTRGPRFLSSGSSADLLARPAPEPSSWWWRACTPRAWCTSRLGESSESRVARRESKNADPG